MQLRVEGGKVRFGLDGFAESTGVVGSADVEVVIKVGVDGDVLLEAFDGVCHPWPEFCSGVVVMRAAFEAVETDVGEVGGEGEIHGHAQGADGDVGGIVFAEDVEGLRMFIPGRMTKLKGVTMFGAADFVQEFIESFGIEMKIWRDLPEDGTAFFAEAIGAAKEFGDGGAVDIQALDVGDEAAAFDGEDEIFRSAIVPALDDAWLG